MLQDKPDHDHPLVYADQVMSMAIGPFVSRITFGIENHGAATRLPVATVVIPTNIIHSIAAELVKQLDSEGFKSHAAGQYPSYLGPEAFGK
jgi:hypothetical protein